MVATFCRADRLRLAALFQSTEKECYYLNGVSIQTSGNGVRLCATDGHRLVMFRDEAGFTCAPCIVSVPKVARQIIKAAKPRDSVWFAIMGQHGGTGRHEARLFHAGEAELGELGDVRESMEDMTRRGILWAGPIELIDGEFPDLDAVMPAKRATNGENAAFNSKLMADFGQVAGDLDRKPYGPVRVYQANDEPAIVDCGRHDFVGVIMPMQSDPASVQPVTGYVLPPGWAKAVA